MEINETQIRHIDTSPGGPFICFIPRKSELENQIKHHTKRKINTLNINDDEVIEPPQQRERITELTSNSPSSLSSDNESHHSVEVVSSSESE